jgi:hypothetical protein
VKRYDDVIIILVSLDVHKGRTPPLFKKKFYTAMAEIQVRCRVVFSLAPSTNQNQIEMTSIRFPKIGTIVRLSNGTFSVGPIPGVGGPFDSAAAFFKAWAKNAKFPYNENTIRKMTPPELVDKILISIEDFPSQLTNFSQHHCFRRGPFPVIHPDLYKSNILINSEYSIRGVIDWENAIIAPWEMVEFIKDLSIVPPVMYGPLYHENEEDRETLAERRKYVEVVRKMEKARQLDNNISTVLGDWNTQNLAHAIWLFLEGKIGFYTSIIKLFE